MIKLSKIILTVVIVVLISLAAGGYLFTQTAAFGRRPDVEAQKRHANSPNFDKETLTFVNQDPHVMERMNARMSLATMVKLQFQSAQDVRPEKPLPTLKPDFGEFMKPSSKVKAIWFGHSTILFQLNGKTVLMDPIFSKNAAPVTFLIERYQPPAAKLEELPSIDYILISHDHYDHLDLETIQYFLNQKIVFIVPLGVGGHLEGWGIDRSRIVELDWWGKHDAEDISFIATPAQHFSGRSLVRNETLWSGWILQSEASKVFYSGDSGYSPHYREISEKHGPFDVAFIDSGQYNKLWEEVHNLPDQAVQAFIDIKAKHFVPVHWGAYTLAKHPWYEPASELSRIAEAKGLEIVTPQMGEIIEFQDQVKTKKWWVE